MAAGRIRAWVVEITRIFRRSHVPARPVVSDSVAVMFRVGNVTGLVSHSDQIDAVSVGRRVATTTGLVSKQHDVLLVDHQP